MQMDVESENMTDLLHYILLHYASLDINKLDAFILRFMCNWLVDILAWGFADYPVRTKQNRAQN